MIGVILLILVVGLFLIWYLNRDTFSLESRPRNVPLVTFQAAPTATAAAPAAPTPCTSGNCNTRALMPELPTHQPAPQAPPSILKKKPATRRSW